MPNLKTSYSINNYHSLEGWRDEPSTGNELVYYQYILTASSFFTAKLLFVLVLLQNDLDEIKIIATKIPPLLSLRSSSSGLMSCEHEKCEDDNLFRGLIAMNF